MAAVNTIVPEPGISGIWSTVPTVWAIKEARR
jgi:hypothetical protein